MADRIQLVGDAASTVEDEMTEAPALPFLERVGRNRLAAGSARVSRSKGLDFESVEAVEIVAPDLYSAALLVGYAAPSFLSEIVPGSAWIVRFVPSTPRGEWVVELLSLVERWLESVPLPCAKALHDDRRYLIRASTHGAQILDLPRGGLTPQQVAVARADGYLGAARRVRSAKRWVRELSWPA